jgi:hypothetical protein
MLNVGVVAMSDTILAGIAATNSLDFGTNDIGYLAMTVAMTP